MKKYMFLVAMFVLCVIGMSSANAATPYVASVNGVPNSSCVTLFAGQHINVGSVCFAIAGSDLVVTYNTTGDWYIAELQLLVSTVTLSGNTSPGQFPNKVEFEDGAYPKSYSFNLPLSGLPFTCDNAPATFYVYAHASVFESEDGTPLKDDKGKIIGSETAWSDGDPFIGVNNWGWYTTIVLDCSDDGGDDPLDDPTDPQPFGTAFAYGDRATCFSEYGFSRWGWTIAIEEEGTYVYDLYAGAGQCDISKGTLVGTLTVEYSGGVVTATYNIMEEYYMEEAHFYAGDAPLPTLKRGKKFVNTVAPGQYPYIEDPVSDPNSCSFKVEVDDVDEDGIFIVAHAASDDSLVTP